MPGSQDEQLGSIKVLKLKPIMYAVAYTSGSVSNSRVIVVARKRAAYRNVWYSVVFEVELQGHWSPPVLVEWFVEHSEVELEHVHESVSPKIIKTIAAKMRR